MGQLHELLAVEGDLRGISEKIVAETQKSFSRKELFLGHTKRLEMKDEDRKNEEAAGSETKIVTTTVMDRLDYTAENVVRYFNALYQKEVTNQSAVADLEVNGKTIATGVPATFLLGLESRLKALRKIYESAPTLQSGIDWVEDEQVGRGIYKSKHDTVATKTEKGIIPQILHEATKEHPAQVEKLSRDVVIGNFVTSTWSGMISSSKKSKMLHRLDELIQSVKRGRMRANKADAATGNIGEELFNYIHNGG